MQTTTRRDRRFYRQRRNQAARVAMWVFTVTLTTALLGVFVVGSAVVASGGGF